MEKKQMREIEYRIFKDGDQWCAVTNTFTNLQESPAGFGGYPMKALHNLNMALAAEVDDEHTQRYKYDL